MSHGSSASRFVGRSFLPSWWGDVQLDDGAEEEDERQRPGPKSVGVTQAAACPRAPGWEMMGEWGYHQPTGIYDDISMILIDIMGISWGF